MPKSPSNGNPSNGNPSEISPLNRNLSPPPLPGSPSPGITAPRSLSDLGLRADFCPFYLLLCWQNPHLARAKLRFCRLASGTEGETRNLRHQKSSGKAQTRQTPRRVLLCLPLSAVFFTGPSLFAETWNFTADSVTSIQRDQGSRTLLEGRARVESDDMEIRAESLELLGPDYDRISGSGSVVLIEIEKGITVESSRFDYDREQELIRFRGRVSLVDEEDGILIRAEALDFFEDDDFVVMTAAVRLIKENTIGRGEFATFRRDEKILELSGRPVVWQDGDEYRADRITVNLETDEIILEGAVEGLLITEGDEEPDENPDEPPIEDGPRE